MKRNTATSDIRAPSPGRRGFTLIELMIAIALSTVVAFTALAGFRTAAEAVTITNRMSTDNAIMRSQFLIAQQYLDYWTDLDDPDDVNREWQRGVTQTADGQGRKGGLPFTPMSQVFPYAPNGNRELDSGWNPHDPWAAHDPRSWFHGHPLLKSTSTMNCGFSSIFSVLNGSTTVNDSYDGVTYGAVQTPHGWWDGQLWGLHDALGYYAYLDYVPAHTLFGCHIPFIATGDRGNGYPNPVNATNGDGVPLLLTVSNGVFCNGDGAQVYPYGRWRLTMASEFAIRSPFVSLDESPGNLTAVADPALTVSDLVPQEQRLFFNGYWYGSSGSLDTANLFRAKTSLIYDTLRVHPASWPSTQITVQRFIRAGRFVNLFCLRSTSSLTGEVRELTFTATATTLRGARQQRRHPAAGGGWSTWDNGGAGNDLTLDDTP